MNCGSLSTARRTRIKMSGPKGSSTASSPRIAVPTYPSRATPAKLLPYCEVRLLACFSRISPPPSHPLSSFPTNPLSIFIVTVLKHQVFGLSTGATIPVLVKAQTIRGTAPTTTALEPYTAICTCTSPPAVTATTSVCAYPPAETTPGI